MSSLIRWRASLTTAALIAACALEVPGVCEPPPNVVPPNKKAVADVAAGRVDTAVASWWGFDPADATRSLQAALNSRAKTVVVDDPGGPWIVTTITLPSEKEILFKPGVVVEAKRGEFREKHDCLFLARGCKRLTLRGEGTIFRMHKDDYHKPPYELAEWRHGLSLRGCEDVLIEAITISQTGGDGIYLGVGAERATNRNVTIRNVVCDGNNRQGVSVITAENLLIENCTFRNTQGTAPQAGIDFEPNHPQERLINCVLLDCRSEDNAGHAYHIYLGHMDHTSPPVSIRFENCTSTGCGRYSTYVGVANREGKRTVRGSIEYVGCRFDADEGAGVYIRGNEADGCRVRFRRCAIVRPDKEQTLLAPFTIEAPRRLDVDAGNIALDDCRIQTSAARPPVLLVASPLTRLRSISGSLTVASPDGTTTYAIDRKQLAEWFPNQGLVDRIERFPFDWRKATPAVAERSATRNGPSFRLRREAALLAWGTKGVSLELSVRFEAVGRSKPSAGTMTVTSPAGETVRLRPAASEDDATSTYTFTPRSTGPYRLDWRGESTTTIRPIASGPLKK